ncbi:MAG: phosphoenolpyruvate kinase [Cyanobacteria bacterium SZAS TMP-1]|nr:phosphoenolpyruvate kinase [Cyanobacteria bacterium SZAS TMP-1]
MDFLPVLAAANALYQKSFPGEPVGRQPLHTVYGGAHLFKAETCRKLGSIALSTLTDYAADGADLVQALAVNPDQADQIYKRIVEKLKREAVEDFRIDFEDGYGYRSNDEEDGHARTAALEVARAMSENLLPPFFGIRVKALNEECKARSAGTLNIFLDTLLDRSAGRLPDNFVVTLPKVVIAEQVRALVELLELIEDHHGLRSGTIKIEIMVEAPQCLVGAQGQMQLPLLVAAAAGRCRGAHFGAYDYTASCDITAGSQSLASPACDFARHMMKVSLAGRGLWLSDGATNVLPIGPHRSREGDALTAAQKSENRAVVHRAWKLAYGDIRHSFSQGFYQGWDLHPAQIPVRYAAAYAFFLEGLPAATQRLQAFIEKAAQASLVGDVFDDAASGQGLLNYFLRAINCGAVDAEQLSAVGLTTEEIAGRSFLRIVETRRK